MSSVVKSWKGVFGFPVTPLKKDLSVDLDALGRNVDGMTQHPFCAFVCAGGTGELYSLMPQEVEDITRVSVDAAQGRMPVVAGTGFNVPIGVDMAQRAEKAGAHCLLILPPYYQNPPEEGLFQYYEAIARATSLPVLIYSREWATFSPSQVARLAERIPNLQGWKDGQGDARKYQRIMQSVGDRLAWFGGIGDDCVPGYFAVGVQAYTSSISNIAPHLSLMLAEAGMKRDFAKLGELMNKYVHPLYAIRDRLRGYEVSVMKEAMEILGMPAGPVRPPLVDTRPQDIEDVRKLMQVYADVL
jgi:5-dehydro-4-deoxyglucarate dehydratase